MGFFDDVGSFFTKTIPATAEKAYKGVKSAGEKAYKGIKSAGETIKREVEGLGTKEAWEQGAKTAGKWLQAPQRWIEANDPLKKHTGGFSTLGLASSFLLAPVTGAGYLTDLTVNKEKQKKLKEGDFDTILDTTMAGVSLLPIRGLGALKSGAKGAKGATKVGRAASKASRAGRRAL